MATTKKRLEQIENALIALGAGGAGFAAGRLGPVQAAKGAGRLAFGTPQGRALLAGASYAALKAELDARDREVAEERFGPLAPELLGITQKTTPFPIPLAQAAAFGMDVAPKVRKKTKSAFNRAVGAAMKAVKNSNVGGKKGVISKPKAVFSKTTKIASRINQAKKAKGRLPKRPKGKVDRLIYDITKRILK